MTHRSLVMSLLLIGCAPEPRAAHGPVTLTVAPPPAAQTVTSSPSAVAPSPSSEPSPENAREAPPLRELDVCADDRASVAALLGKYPKDVEDRSKGSVGIGDLEREAPNKEEPFGIGSSGSGHWGPTDIDGDGVDDLVLGYTSVDFWSHLYFVRRGSCFAFAGYIEGYQVELGPLVGGRRDVRVLAYPIGPIARIEAYRWTGKAFQKKAGAKR
ncbi:Hypothetical protein A7982_01406 [Minicystis rosea]|nr:Hypothetical protein A7982_01406 [Minicystis rosea]